MQAEKTPDTKLNTFNTGGHNYMSKVTS